MLRSLLLIAPFLAAAAYSQQALDPDYGSGDIKTVEIQGTEVPYLDVGGGEPIVIYHPNGGIYHWQWVIEALKAQHRVIVNGPVPALGPPFGADSLIALIEGLGMGPVHLVAHSFGGRQALALATERPDLLTSLVLIEPAGAADSSGVRAQQADFSAGGHSCELPEALRGEFPVDEFQCALQVQINEPGFLQRAPPSLVRDLVESSGESLPLPDDWTLFMPPICEALNDLRMPVLYVRGRLTPEVIQTSQDSYENCLPTHEPVAIDDSAHYPHIYNPDALNTALLEFFSR